MAPRCRRCGVVFEPTSPRQDHCIRCAVEVAAIVAADERRRMPRFPARDMTAQVYGR